MILLAILERLSSFKEHRARVRCISEHVRYLRSFDDRMLDDIGLTRADIEGFVRTRMASRVSYDLPRRIRL